MKASDACVYCHATAGMAVNGRPVYDGLGPAHRPSPAPPVARPTPATSSATNCSVCHTSVHGASADHSVASLDGFLLQAHARNPTVRATAAPTSNMLDADHRHRPQGRRTRASPLATLLPARSATTPTINTATMPRAGRRRLLRRVPQRRVRHRRRRCGHQRPRLRYGRVLRPPHRRRRDDRLERRTAPSRPVCPARPDRVGSGHQLQVLPRRHGQLRQRRLPARLGRPTKMWLCRLLTPAPPRPTCRTAGRRERLDAGRPQLSDGVCLKCHVASGGTAGVGITF